MILESFDQKTLAKMAAALEQACALVSAGNQKHRSRRYIAQRLIQCASGGKQDLDSLIAAGTAAAEKLNASRMRRGPCGASRLRRSSNRQTSEQAGAAR